MSAENKKQLKKLVIIGFGPHSKRVYYKMISEEVINSKLEFIAVIDLKSKKKEIDDFFTDKEIKPQHFFYVEDKNQIDPISIDKNVKEFLDELIADKKIDRAIIGTEPKSHEIYLNYFVDNKITCLTDKPVFAYSGLSYDKKVAERQYKNILKLNKKSIKNKVRVYVQVQRREHKAYNFIFNIINQIIDKYKVPITYFHIFHSDGSWNMPNEFVGRENHPYKYGYGKIMHSGYHFVDIVSRIIESNQRISEVIKTSINSKSVLANDNYEQLGGGIFIKGFLTKTQQFQKNIILVKLIIFQIFLCMIVMKDYCRMEV